MISTALLDDSIFAGRYRVVRCIAAGGMGAVYEVIHLETERKRALKVMHPHFVSSAELRERFKREAKVAAQIDSDYIVDVFDAGVDEATQAPFLVMELLKGEELGKRLARVGRFSPIEALDFLWQTALALDKCHKANVVHRDLKPENLFLNQRDDGPARVKVLDFGVAKFVAEVGTQAHMTRSVGTPLYMAPEQFRGHNVTGACDDYALAMMAYTMLVGEAYWAPEAANESTVFGFAMHVQAGPVEPPSTRAARRGVALTSEFDRWFRAATSVNPAERFPSATATIAALGEVLGMNPARLVGVAASDPLGAQPAFRASGTELMGPTQFAASRSGAVSGISHGISGAGALPAAQPRSRAGAFAAVAAGVLVVGGIVALVVVRGRAQPDASPAAAPVNEVAASASAQPGVAPAATPAASAAATAETTASAAASSAPSAAPSADAEASAAPRAPEPSARPAAAAAAPRPPGRLPGKPAGAAAAPPKPSAAPAAPPAAPAPKQPTYTRD